MLRKKLILLGAPQVGKTSLVARWVKGIFSEKYLSTIGVKIEKKLIETDKQTLTLLIWDLMGNLEIVGSALSYIRGASAMLLVADGTRPITLEQALSLGKQAFSILGNIPCALVLNKADQNQSWEISPTQFATLEKGGWTVFETSALTGAGVDTAFMHLAQELLNKETIRSAI
jgi:small GTP-binding protein